MHLLKGLSYCNLGDYQNAASAYTDGLTKATSFTVLYLLRAEVRSKQGDSEGATEDLALVQHIIAAQSGQFSCEQLIPSK